jgi:hypothetical protein
MWYLGFENDILTRIGVATSSDGVSWTKYGGNPVLDIGPPGAWDSLSLGDPTVLFDGSTYQMWFMGSMSVPTAYGELDRIGYATSTDGLHWTKHGGNPVLDMGPPGSWEDLAIFGPTVLFAGGCYKMWYAGQENVQVGTRWPYARIGYADTCAPAVGGLVMPANTLALVAPWLAIIGLVGCIGTVVVVAKKRRA